MGIVVAGSSLGGIFIPLIFTRVLAVAGFGKRQRLWQSLVS